MADAFPMDGLYSPNVEAALRVSFRAHEGQTRKGQSTPYATHPVHVAMLLARAGADAVTLQAALLHDVVEDCDDWTIEDIERQFGADVAQVVSDLTEVKGPSWEERKGAALQHVAHMGERALAVKTADKLHNMQSLYASLEASASDGDVWNVFSRGPEQTLEHAAKLAGALDKRLGSHAGFGPLVRELVAVVDALRAR